MTCYGQILDILTSQERDKMWTLYEHCGSSDLAQRRKALAEADPQIKRALFEMLCIIQPCSFVIHDDSCKNSAVLST